MYFCIAAILFSLVLPFASANGCYNRDSAPANANSQFASDHVGEVANFLQGKLASQQSRGTCVVDTPNNNHWWFAVDNHGKGDVQIDQGVIHDKLNQLVLDCSDHGGEKEDGDIRYTVDPNPGICFDSVFIGEHPPPRRRSGATIPTNNVVFIPMDGPARIHE
ncbi:hypothetical protein PSPO01_16182 [Paraphaeosphaeria sporulosa]